jgi:hypothetical protein
MRNIDIAYAASVLTQVAAAPALEVRERAVTQGDIRGQVCPNPGSTDFRALTQRGSGLSARHSGGLFAQSGSQQWTGISAAYGAEIVVISGMNNVQLSKPRTGYCAMSGAG